MKSLLLLFPFIFSMNCFAIGIGSKRVLTGQVKDERGNLNSRIVELVVTGLKNSKYQVKEIETVYNSDGDLVESRVRFNWLATPIPDGQLFNPNEIDRNCETYYHGIIENVTVPAGTFKSCKVEDADANGDRETVWFGPVPFEVVKSKIKGAKSSSEYVLKEYILR